MYPREIPPGGRPLRWTRERAWIRLREVPAGAATLEVNLRGHRGPVAIALDGVVLGLLEPGRQQAVFTLALPSRASHVVELRTEPFVAGDGRRLGTLLENVILRPAAATAPSARLLWWFVVTAAAAAGGAALAGLQGPRLAAAMASFTLLQALLLWPHGLIRSAYAPRLSALLATVALTSGVVARLCERRRHHSGRWAFLALCASMAVQGVLATSPVMVVSDAVFHANNLARVEGGDLLLTSVTQHARPFRFPYGISFYVLLAPLLRSGVDAVTLVRAGAAVAAVAAGAALFLLVLRRRTAAEAAAAVVLLQLLPMTLDVHSHGNLSNVFGQAMTILFFAWWSGGTPGGWPLGSVLLFTGALGHFSSLVVLAVLCACLALRGRRERSRTHWMALGVGLGAALAYYAFFTPLVLGQLPRLLEGGGQGRAASRTALDALWLQLLALALQWGVPALILGWLGRPRPARSPFDRDLVSYWLAGGLLAVLATVSPVETRYLYALTLALAVAAGAGGVLLWQRGGWARLAAAALLAAQAALAGANALQALLWRYR